MYYIECVNTYSEEHQLRSLESIVACLKET